jgi:S-adenosylmethionine uptake transporter
MTDNMRGALLMIASMASFTLNDTFVKLLLQEVPFSQVLVIRGIFALVVISALTWRLGAFRLSVTKHDWKMLALRAVAETGAAYFFLTALANMPIANITALLQLLPLTVTLGAAMFLGQSVGWRRLLAIAIGFIGMLLIVKPAGADFNQFTIYGLISVLCVTARDLATRAMSSAVPSMFITWSTSVAVLAFFVVFSTQEDWITLSTRQTLWLAGCSISICFGYLLSVLVMRKGDIAFVTPFRYTGLLWALIAGWFIFGDWPDALTLIGAVIIVGMGLFTMMREAQLKLQSRKKRGIPLRS